MSSAAALVLSRVAVPLLPLIGRIWTRTQPVPTDPATQLLGLEPKCSWLYTYMCIAFKVFKLKSEVQGEEAIILSKTKYI